MGVAGNPPQRNGSNHGAPDTPLVIEEGSQQHREEIEHRNTGNERTRILEHLNRRNDCPKRRIHQPHCAARRGKHPSHLQPTDAGPDCQQPEPADGQGKSEQG